MLSTTDTTTDKKPPLSERLDKDIYVSVNLLRTFMSLSN